MEASTGEPNGQRRAAGTAALVAVALVAVAAFSVPLAGGETVPSGQQSGAVGDASVLQTDEPMASLTVSPAPAHPGDPVTLDATGSTAGESDEIARCRFDTDGDGTYEIESDSCLIDRSYETTGEYNVSVRVVTTSDRTATASAVLTVRENEPPSPAIVIDPPSIRPGDAVVLSGADSTDADGEVVGFEWTVGGRTLAGETVETTFDAPGEREVVLAVTDDDGGTATMREVVAVQPNEPPTAELVVEPGEAAVGDSIALDASESTDPEGAIVEYRWDFDGDGTVDRRTEEPETTYRVETAGELVVQVTVVDDREATDRETVAFVVQSTETIANQTGDTGDRVEDDGQTRRGLAERLDPGIVPLVPDWIAIALLCGAIAGVIAHRRESIPSRVRRLRERIHEGEFRRNLAKKATGFVSKTMFKRVFRKLADVVEASGNAVGEGLEWLGRTIKRASKRVADVLRSIGG